jgi:hypothetical protein
VIYGQLPPRGEFQHLIETVPTLPVAAD